MEKLLLALALFALPSWGATRPLPIPRVASENFRTSGLFEGGSALPANLEAVRLSENGEIENWEIEFSDGKRQVGKVAPKFQVRYIPGNRVIGPTGEPIWAQPAKFIFTFRSIKKNFLANREKLAELVKQSKHVKEIIVYPPIEDGDTAIEFVLKENVAFEPHQPIQKEGRLVLALKSVEEKSLQ